jgi:2,5-diamino-6-(ribosylamino)-4(3H)-pyrimidinone 5'-phosphate reductase
VNGLEGEWKPVKLEEQPRPVIIDPHRRAHLSKLLQLVSVGQSKSPWILCQGKMEAQSDRYVPMKVENGRFQWSDILSTLSTRGIESLMIEGGANVINDVLSAGLADVIIITIAPVFLGHDAVAIAPSLLEVEWLQDVRSISVGKDVVVAGRVKR